MRLQRVSTTPWAAFFITVLNTLNQWQRSPLPIIGKPLAGEREDLIEREKMEIQISSHREIPGLEEGKIRGKIARVLKDLGCHDKELSILFTDDSRMAQLNLRYLGRKGPTNVLAFPMADLNVPDKQIPAVESVMLGDVVISIDTALSEADEFGETIEHTIDRLLIHGVLHLMGYDHEEAEALLMEKQEKKLMGLIEAPDVRKV